MDQPGPTAVNRLKYSRDELLHIGSFCSSMSFDTETYSKILTFNSSLRHAQKTKRGVRAGKRKKNNLKKSNLNICILNARSARNKTSDICDLILKRDLDVFFITETWIQAERDDVIKAKLTPPGYTLLDRPRTSGKKGGGIAVIYKSHLQITLKTSDKNGIKSFEFLESHLSVNQRDLRFVCIYRPPASKRSVFHKEFSYYLQYLATKPCELLVFGDMNFHFDNPNSDTKKLTTLLQSLDMKQHIQVPTHESRHIIDWVMSRSSEQMFLDICVVDLEISDHFPIFGSLNVKRPKAKLQKIIYRNIRHIDRDAFRQDIAESPLLTASPDFVDEYANLYHSTLTALIDKHAPKTEKIVSLKPSSPWYNDSIKNEKTTRRRLEKQWKRSKLEVDRQMYVKQRQKVNYMMKKAKADHINSKVKECDAKQMFKLTSTLMNKTKDSTLPEGEDPADIANRFASFFDERIENIYKQLESSVSPETDTFNTSNQGSKMSLIKPFTKQEIRNIIHMLPPQSCELDPIPTSLLLESLDVLLQPIVNIINLSVQQGKVPLCLKRAIVRPLLKENDLDRNCLNNYRPVSNLTFLSKVLEKAVELRLCQHLDSNYLREPHQSAYRQGHSMETALVKVTNDLLLAAHKGKLSCLVLLDLSAPFDTICHRKLLRRMEEDLGITGTALDWFSSYLSDRSQSVTIMNVESAQHDLHRGVPQGSVLGPVLFTLYTQPLSNIANKHNISQHQYAVDNQLYTSFTIDDQPFSLEKMEACCEEIQSWMTNNFLKLNGAKTEFIIIGQKCKVSTLRTSAKVISVGGSAIQSTPKVKNLGVYIDEHLKMTDHVSHICKTASVHLRHIGKIRQYLSVDAATKLMIAFVTSRLFYCNSLLKNISKDQIQRLQLIQDTAARIVSKTRKFDHIRQELERLHWLPIKARIDFKLLTLAYLCFHNMAPSYLTELLPPYRPKCTLRSQDKMLLSVPKVKSTSYGKRSFQYAAASLWNNLPADIRSLEDLASFKKQLKTHIFKTHYP